MNKYLSALLFVQLCISISCSQTIDPVEVKIDLTGLWGIQYPPDTVIVGYLNIIHLGDDITGKLTIAENILDVTGAFRKEYAILSAINNLGYDYEIFIKPAQAKIQQGEVRIIDLTQREPAILTQSTVLLKRID